MKAIFVISLCAALLFCIVAAVYVAIRRKSKGDGPPDDIYPLW